MTNRQIHDVAQNSPGQATSTRVFEDNPLIKAANPLLNAIPQLRNSVGNVDISTLKQQLIDEVRRFEVRGQRAGLTHEVLIGARYCLCTALDESISLTPWGKSSVWSRSGLLVTFHNEAWGGEKFFQLLAKLSQSPKQHLYLLEMIYYCLLFGFEGRYRIIENGRTQLETLKQRLLQLIRTARGNYMPALSPNPVDLPVQTKPWKPMIPLWACAALAGFLACLWFISLNWRLSDLTSPLLTQIYQVELPRLDIKQTFAPPTKPMISLRGFLLPEIAEGLLSVRDDGQQSIVVLRGDGLFNSGSDVLLEPYLPVLQKVAQALNQVEGAILVAGYTDSDPIRTSRFASNWELSESRANTVKSLLERLAVNPTRIQAEGRGDTNPVAPNNSKANKALNRRVEVTLILAPQNAQAQLGGAYSGSNL